METRQRTEGPGRDGISIRKIEEAAIRGDPKHPIDEQNHRMWFRASTNQPCPDGIIIDADAWDKDMVKKDGALRAIPFCDSHDYSSAGNVIGKTVDWDTDDIGLLLLQEFAADAPDPLPRHLWYMASHDYVQAGSVSWDTLERGESEKIGDRTYEHVSRAKLREFSLCVVGLDDEALKVHNDPRLTEAVTYIRSHGGRPDGARPGWDETDNQIRYRIKDPGLFVKGSFKTLSLDVKGERDVQVVRGKLTDGDGEMHAQSIHFVKAAGWTEANAKSWWAKHKDDLGRGVDIETIREAPDRIAEIIERLERIEKAVVEILDDDFTVRLIQDNSETCLGHAPKPCWELPPELRRLERINSDLEGEALTDRLREIQRDEN